MPLWNAFLNAIGMSRKGRIGPDEAERLIAEGRDPARPELERLLAAATAPPRPGELAGLDEALAAFEAAGRAPRPAPARRRRRALRPIAAAAAVSVLLVGGVAVAAETGYLPGVDPPGTTESRTPSDVTSSAASPSQGGASSPATRAPAPTASAQAPAPVDPAMARLCRTWDDHRAKGKPMSPEELGELARAAGGEQRIAAYCAPLLRAPESHGPPTSRPSASHPAPNTSDNPGKDKGGQNDGGPTG